MKTHIQPESFVPISPTDFIGGARDIAKILKGKADRLRDSTDGQAKLLLYGVPGVGKTKLSEYFAGLLADNPVQIEMTIGRNVTPELIRRWTEAGHYLSVFGNWSVKIVDELDTCPPAAQDLLLGYLDRMPRFHAFVGTSNLDLNQLVERFQTRLQQFKVEAPETEAINVFLKQWKLTKADINQIAVGCGGNVRAALLDAQSFLDARAAR